MLKSHDPLPGEGSPFDVPAAIGRYRVLHQIGAGSLGPVFRGEIPQSPQAVAIKIFRLNLERDAAERILDALRDLVARAPRHDALVELIDADLHDVEPFLAMSFVEGDPLDAALREFGPAAILDALPRLRSLAAALDRGAAHGFWHGELNPRDIMVSPDQTVLLGLGIGPLLEREGIALPVRRTYTAPDLLDGASSSPAGDQYALAAIAHEWLLGRRILGPSDTRRVDVPDLPGVNRELLTAALKKALSPIAGDRFESCEEFIDHVEASTGRVVARSIPVSTPVIPVTEPADVPPVIADLPLTPVAAPQQADLQWAPAEVEAPDVEPELQPKPIERRPRVASFAPEFGSTTATHGYGAGVLAATLLVGLAIGGFGGYWFGKSSDRAPAPASALVGTPPSEKAADAATAPAAVNETPLVPIDLAPTAKPSPPPPQVAEAPPPPAPPVTDTPRAAPPARTTTKPATKTAPTKTARKATPPAAAPQATATLVIESRPARASVTVNGRSVGSTPVTLSAIPPGTHTVSIERPGYRRWTTTVHITPGQRARVAASLVGGQTQQ